MLPILLYENRLNDGTPVASSTAAGFDVLNLRDLRAFTFWKAANSSSQTITVDCGAAKAVDCFALLGHNLGTVGASLVVMGSDDNFAADSRIFYAEKAGSDTALLDVPRVIANGEFEVWSAGTSVAPTAWTKTGAGSTVARDSGNQYSGAYCAALTRSGADCYLDQRLDMSHWAGKTVTIGVRGKYTGAANVARVLLREDGVVVASAYHSGGGVYELLTMTRNVAPGVSTELLIRLKVETADGTVYWDRVRVKEGSSISEEDFSDRMQPVMKRYWRLHLSEMSAAPQIAVLMIGGKLQFPYPPATPFSPWKEGVETETKRGKTGHILGTVVRYFPRSISARFVELTRAFVFNTFMPFWEGHASLMKPFFFAWDLDEYPGHVLFGKVPDNAEFEASLSRGDVVDELKLEVEGVRE